MAVADVDREIVGVAGAALRRDGKAPAAVVGRAGGRGADGGRGDGEGENAGADDVGDHGNLPV